MRFPLKVVGVGKQNIIGRNHIKYVDNMDLTLKLMIWMGKSQKIRRFRKKPALKTDFECEKLCPFKKDINGNQRTRWWCKMFYEVTHFYKNKWGSLLQ
jgi:hypothetical protein